MVSQDKISTQSQFEYTENEIRTLDWRQHLRLRHGMYIGNLGDGSSIDDGIYMLFKEVMDNSVDEFLAGFGKCIEVTIEGNTISIRDYGRGIPLGKVVDAVSKINTGSNFGSRSFRKTAGMNGVGIKAVNALSSDFKVISYRNNQQKQAFFSKGEMVFESELILSDERDGTLVTFAADETLFKNLEIRYDIITSMIRHYICLNPGLTVIFNGQKFISKNGIGDLLANHTCGRELYPPIELSVDDISVIFTHVGGQEEKYLSFVNGQYTYLGGPHVTAFKESISNAIKTFFKKNWDNTDVRSGIIAVISVRLEEPVFDSQKKNKLGSVSINGGNTSLSKLFRDFIGQRLDNYLHKNSDIAKQITLKIKENERIRKAASCVKSATSRTKGLKLKNNKKLLDCQVHYCNSKADMIKRNASSIFITEGDSAGGSITKVRDVETQAVFCLKGKTLNTYRSSFETIKNNEELQSLWQALNIDAGISGLPYNKVIIATDADVDGMHIRLLLVSFFLSYYPELVRQGHLYILQTPLYRVRKHLHGKRNKNLETYYCYTDEEKEQAISRIGKDPEITRFKGLGEISPNEFAIFINENMRITQVELSSNDDIDSLLEFFMGKNTSERQNFIIDNLQFDNPL